MDEIIVGTYEGFLLGYIINTENKCMSLKQSFAVHSHVGAVKSIDQAGKFLASGGADDKTVIVDMKLRMETNVLMEHNGTVNAVALTHCGTHLISGGEDGYILMHRVGNWQLEKKWKKAHGGLPVTAIAIHPSDKLALSVGGDKTLRTWNLVKGRPAFTINLNSKGVTMPTSLSWCSDGDRFTIISMQNVDVWSISKAGLEKRISCNSRPSCCCWIDSEKLAIGLDNGNILLVTIETLEAKTFHAHGERVKCIVYREGLLCTVSSAGQIKVWSYSNQGSLVEKCSTKCGCRVTCLALRQAVNIKKEELPEKNEEDGTSDVEIEPEPTELSDKELSEESSAEKPPPKKKSKKKKVMK